MKVHILTLRKALNKAFLRVKPNRSDIEVFKANLTRLLNGINDAESEEFHKNLITEFLKESYYKQNYSINTKGRNDLVIHNGNTATTTVGVIIEAKKPTNKAEMLTPEKVNAKALHELVLYYLRERITHKNIEIKHLIATNINEWFVFDASVFDQLFAQNKILVKQFTDFEEGRLADTKTDFFYKQIIEPFINENVTDIEFTHFNIQDFRKPLLNADKTDDNKLIPLFKILSPEHLLKLPFTNDSNTLDKRFYSELLHIIGLTETKEGSKKLIERKKEGERNNGSLLESAIIQIDSLDKISRLPNKNQYGETYQERLFNIGLELCITWINRILFMKLLEAQLVAYHRFDRLTAGKGNKEYEFLNFEKIKDYDDLNSLFFQVLARRHNERIEDVKKNYEKVPYLNSSLFEPTDLEHNALFISQLQNVKPIPIFAQTVLKDSVGKKRTGDINPLEYLFEFLNAYDFSSEGSEEIQEENKTLINASVLGLIFEKINGYKDGSFFTPGFITMYMCRETIRRAVVQKFNEANGWNCTDIHSLYDKIEDRNEANKIINDLKICDPAVGSGHFLVSALNEIIAIKSELRILQDRQGQRLKEYHFEVVNDELIVTDENGKLFEYNPSSRESQRIQEALFHEKQTIIENCLFGVDINPNSVKICRLRLWIELLKNAYYEVKTGHAPSLQTLPNIDINIKCGNSLVSRYPLNANLKTALKKSKWSIDSYRLAITTYRNTNDKQIKRDMEKLILNIKQDFTFEIRSNDPLKSRLDKLANELYNRFTGNFLFEPEVPYGMSEKELEKKRKKEQEKLEKEIALLTRKMEEIKNNKIYENAFEWRFEFPEVLNNDGDFVGFDVVIGNPPYIRQEEFADYKPYLSNNYACYVGAADLFVYFIELGIRNLKKEGQFSFITPNKWMRAGYGKELREFLVTQRIQTIIDFGDLPVFEEATTYPSIISLAKGSPNKEFKALTINSLTFPEGLEKHIFSNQTVVKINELDPESWNLSNSNIQHILSKIKKEGVPLAEFVEDKIFYGIKTGFNEAFVIDSATKNRLIEEDPNCAEIIKPLLAGRDIKRYQQPKSEKYLIFAKKGIEIEKYTSVHSHLLKYKAQLEKKAGGNAWYELQASPADADKFERTKIMYPDISKDMNFIIDYSGHYSINTVYNISSESKALLAYLNSKLFRFYYQNISNSIRGGYMRFFTEYIKECPIPKEIRILEALTVKIIDSKKENPTADTTALETQIDHLVYELYGLTEEEIKIVEGQ